MYKTAERSCVRVLKTNDIKGFKGFVKLQVLLVELLKENRQPIKL